MKDLNDTISSMFTAFLWAKLKYGSNLKSDNYDTKGAKVALSVVVVLISILNSARLGERSDDINLSINRSL